LSIVGNRLCITIPETWLGEAKYPVLVDPTVGTTTIGSQTNYRNEDNELEQLYFELSIGVNRFYISENLSSTATAYVYAYDKYSDISVRPVIYSDNNNVPKNRLSKAEGSYDVSINTSKPASCVFRFT
jgi:hypothetical protein